MDIEFKPFVLNSAKYGNKINLNLKNVSGKPIKIENKITIGKVLLTEYPFDLNDLPDDSVVSDDYIDYIKDKYPVSSRFVDDDDEANLPPDFDNLIAELSNDDTIDDQVKGQLFDSIFRHKALFSKSVYDIGLVKNISHDLILKDTIPFKLRNRSMPVKIYAATKAHIDELIDKKIIRPSNSNYSSAPLFVKKKDGRIQMVADLRILNDKTIRDNYALPRLENIIPHLSGKTIFSKLDIRAGYFNVMVTEEYKAKTAFTTPFGLYEYNRLPMGAKNSGATFQRAMETILRKLLNDGVIVYLDDIICYSDNVQDHLRILDRVFDLLLRSGIKVNPCKCELFRSEIKYLGHIMNKHGLRPDPDK